MINSLWTPSSALDSFLTAIYLPLTAAILPNKSSLLPISVQVMAPVFTMTLPSHMWPPSQATGSGSVNNLWPRIGIFGHRLFIWLLDPSLSLQFCWVDGFGPHINHLSTSLMTQPQTHFTSMVTMVSAIFSKLPNALVTNSFTCYTYTLSQPWHTTLP